MARPGFFERLARLGRTTDESAMPDMQQRVPAEPAVEAIGRAVDRDKVRVRGTITTLTIRPRQTTPWLEAELSDGTGSVTLVWMGRREIPGIEAGRELIVEGRIAAVDDARRIYNPRYQLL